MALYKYCGEAGKFIIQNLEIKVTPPNELNDTCEMRPGVINSDPMAWARRFLDKALTDPSYYNRSAHVFPNFANFYEFQVFANNHRADLLAKLELASPDLDANLQNEVLATVSAKWGVVSLSTNPVEDLMWAHYADSHKGLLVKFDETDDLFTHPSFLKCEYFDSPATYDPSNGPNQASVEQFARRKKTKWTYEQESRLIVPLSLCRNAPGNGAILYLLALEPSVIISVTFGQRTSDSLKQEVVIALQRPELAHVTKWQIKEGATPYDLNRVQLP